MVQPENRVVIRPKPRGKNTLNATAERVQADLGVVSEARFCEPPDGFIRLRMLDIQGNRLLGLPQLSPLNPPVDS